jgi:LEA14-like dessication related protein
MSDQKMASGKIIAVVAVLIIVMAVASIGVYYYDAYHKLAFQLDSVSVTDLSLSSLQMNLVMEIGNPNLLPIYIPSGSFEIYINSQHLGKGNFGSTTIAGNSKDQIAVPITFSISDLPAVLNGLIIGGGNVTVSVQGSINLVFFSVPFNSTVYNGSVK